MRRDKGSRERGFVILYRSETEAQRNYKGARSDLAIAIKVMLCMARDPNDGRDEPQEGNRYWKAFARKTYEKWNSGVKMCRTLVSCEWPVILDRERIRS